MKKSSLVEIFPAKKRGIFLKINGKSVISEFDPILEGERVAERYKETPPPLCFIFMGILPLYHIECILNQFLQDCTVWIFEEQDVLSSIFYDIVKEYREQFPSIFNTIQKKKYS